MDLRQLAYVVAVADHGSFTAAAAASYVSQPTLSHGIRSLERHLGVDLFFRLGRSVAPTPAGELVIERARVLLNDAQALQTLARSASDGVVGRLDIATLATLAVQPTARLVGRFRSTHDQVTVRVVEPDAGLTVTDLVRTGAVEVGLTDVTAGAADVVVVPLFRQTYRLVAPPGLLAVGVARITPAVLAGLPLITTPPGTSSRALLDDALHRVGRAPNIVVEVAHRDAIVPLVAAGAGAAIVPADVAYEAEARGMVVADLQPEVRRRVGLVHRRGPLTPPARVFRDLAVAAATDDAPAR